MHEIDVVILTLEAADPAGGYAVANHGQYDFSSRVKSRMLPGPHHRMARARIDASKV